MNDHRRCPCGSGDSIAVCCAPILAGSPASTAERLMRSRYTAFALGDVAHLRRSWHASTRPEVIEIDADLQWRRLQIIDRLSGGPFDRDGVVEFEAFWFRDGERGSLRERSRFLREDREWLYLDGDIG